MKSVHTSIFALAALLFLAFAPEAHDADVSSAHGAKLHGVIVVDPGHGGQDTGAIGPGGTAEKDVTLKLARKLAAKLRKKLGCTVLLTRSDDTFIPLWDRTAFANSVGADLFISIHANAAPSREVDGIETFFLSFEATDEDARRVAAFENSVPFIDNAEYGEKANDLKDILTDLARTESHHESSALAESIQASMLKATGKEDRGVKQAPFVVLTGAVMPAVLVEVGFISNPKEERWLKAGKDQTKIADSIAEGIAKFRNGTGREYAGYSAASAVEK